MNLKTLLMPLGGVWRKLVNCLPAIVLEVEQAMKDGKITAAERKQLALKVVDEVAVQFGVKLGWLARLVIGWLINMLARKLPSKDIIIPEVVLKVTKGW